MKKVILDTNAYTRFLASDHRVIDEIATADIVYMSVIIIGELLGGFKKGSKEAENRKNLEVFLAKPLVEVIDITRETAEVYAQITHNLKRRGTPIPTNDVWIAAHTIETGAKLTTYDAHFLKVPGLRVWEAFAS